MMNPVPRPSRKTLHQRTISIGFLLLNTLVWGAALPIAKPGLEITTPFRFLFGRFLVAALVIFPMLAWYLYTKPNLKKFVPRILALEILGTTISLSLLYFGLDLTSALESSLITTTVPIFTILGGIIFLREKEERREWIGLTIAFAGTLLLVVEPLFRGSWQAAEFSLLGNTLVFAQNIAISAYYLLAKKWYRQIPKLFASGVSFWVGAVSFAALSWWESWQQGELWLTSLQTDFSAPAVQIAILYMAILGSIVGLTAYIKGQDGIEASEASMFTYLQPLVYIPLTWMMFGDTLSLPLAAALVIIAIGVGFSEIRKD